MTEEKLGETLQKDTALHGRRTKTSVKGDKPETGRDEIGVIEPWMMEQMRGGENASGGEKLEASGV